MSKQNLTKSRFKTGYECPTKLYYLNNPDYGNNKKDNSFLKSLAEGGFQVGELAKLYYPNGIEIKTKEKPQAWAQTQEFLRQENVVLFEPAFSFENLFIRVDILVKRGNFIELIEVKAKSYHPKEDSFRQSRNPQMLDSDWEPYLVDVAFQNHVIQKCYSQFKISSYLMLADKSAVATVDGLNQNFLIKSKNNEPTEVIVKKQLSPIELGQKLLIKVSVDDEISIIQQMTFKNELSFLKAIDAYSQACSDGTKIVSPISSECKNCEFRVDESKELKSGFNECWSMLLKNKYSDNKPLVFDIWDFRSSQKKMEEGLFFAQDLELEDIESKTKSKTKSTEPGLKRVERQWLQIEKIKTGNKNPFLDVKGLSQEFSSFTYPLHFIDFETTMVAIPFHSGRRPYEQIAFQFSHHEVTKSGLVTHADQYLHFKRGEFPNFEFVRQLKKVLSRDEGTIFRYSNHENTVLCQIREQLKFSEEPDRIELINFIESITKSSGKSEEKWEGPRNMIDLCDLVKKYYFSPQTKGSNSIKKVLPALLSESTYLQKKYAMPIYGSSDGIKSLNYTNWTWLKKEITGSIIDPYKQLPPLFDDLDLATMDTLVGENTLADGGAAMTSYARMQFTDMSELEAQKIAKGLLKYCELDTLAMVMIYEHWKNEINTSLKKAV